MEKNPDIALLIPSLARSGGAERVMAAIANHWAAEERRCSLITFDGPENDHYPVAEAVVRRHLNGGDGPDATGTGILAVLTKIVRLRRLIRRSRPALLVSFMERPNVIAILALLGLPCRAVVCERIDPRYHSPGRAWSLARRWLYPLADAVVVQTEAVRQWAASFVSPAKVFRIPNFVQVPEVVRRPAPTPGHCRFVAMGRLSDQKGFDLLIRAFASIAANDQNWRLTIVGDGPLRRQTEEFAAASGVSDRIEFTGRVTDPERILGACDIFVLSSRYEGFPNALLEAMAIGLPVISFDCPSGPGEIIENGKNGILVPQGDWRTLAEEMARLAGDRETRQAISEQARRVVDRYQIDKVMAQWDEVVAKVMAA